VDNVLSAFQPQDLIQSNILKIITDTKKRKCNKWPFSWIP